MKIESIIYNKDKNEAFPQRMSDEVAKRFIEEKVNVGELKNKLKAVDFSKKETGLDPALKALVRLVVELKDNVPKYNTILSDEIGGRLPSLLLREIINKKRKKMGLPSADIYFLNVGKDKPSIIKKAIQKFILEKKDTLGKVLVVSEFLVSGENVEMLTKPLEGIGVDFDVATVSVSARKIEDLDNSIKHHLYYGDTSGVGEWLDDREPLGVQSSVYSYNRKYPAHPEANRVDDYINSGFNKDTALERYKDSMDTVSVTRKKIHLIADEFIKLVE